MGFPGALERGLPADLTDNATSCKAGMKRIAILILGVLTVALLSGCTIKRVLYLSPSGSDSNPGTQARPWKTFDASLRKLQPGDLLLVRGGTYDERIFLNDARDATTDLPIIVRNYQNERPIIKGILQIGTPTYWTIDGINVTWGSSNSNGELLVRIYGGNNWTLQNSEIWGARSAAGLHVDDGPGNSMGRWTVRNNCIRDTVPTNGTNQDHLIYVPETKNGTGLIEGNILFNSPNGRGIKLGPGGSTGGPTNVTIRYNTFYENRGPSNIQLSRDTSNITIERNLMQGSDEQNVTGWELYGTGNVGRNNLGWKSQGGVVVENLPGNLQAGSGNVYRDPKFNAVGCNAFRPQDTQAKAFGKYALTN